jgi:SAM-dependent methyltransferase
VYALLLRELGAAVAAVDTFAEYAERCDNQMGQAGEIIARMEGRGITVRRSDIMVEPIPAADASCDVATLFAVIEHLHGSPARVMRELHRILKPGGFVFLTAPNIAWIRTRLRLLFGRTVHPPYEEWWREPYYSHVREPTLRELRCALEWSGFEVVHTAYGNYAHASARLSGEPPRWTPSFQLRTGRQVMVALSNLVTALVPSMRFTLLAAGRRPPH